VSAPLRLLLFDRTCVGAGLRPGLSGVWAAGRQLYRALGRLDAGYGAATWDEGLQWLAGFAPERPIAEIQFWGHGRWGQARIGEQVLDGAALQPGHPLHQPRLRLRPRLLPAGAALWWFRTCETFGTAAGHAFARAWTEFLGCRAAGHTFVIGAWQSGLHTLAPGAEPTWSVREGLPPNERAPATALPSHRRAPNTITFLHGRVPAGY